MKVAILAPHHDDAVLSAWSVLTGPAEVTVVNVFAGVPPAGTLGGWDQRTGATDSAEHMLVRRREDAAVLAGLGRRGIDLDLLDDQYRERPLEPAAVLDAIAPHVDSAVLYVPAGIGLHRDHLAVREAAEALREEGADVRLYADLPYCARHGWPAWVTGAAEPNPDADDQWALAPAPHGLEPRPVRLEPDAQERKLTALREYRTQFEAMASRESALSDPALLPFEAFWEPPGAVPMIAAASRAEAASPASACRAAAASSAGRTDSADSHAASIASAMRRSASSPFAVTTVQPPGKRSARPSNFDA